jgi:hypothetical protein
MDNPLTRVIAALQERITTKHGLVPHLGYEWEFQLLDDAGNKIPGIEKELQKVLEDCPTDRIYKERGHGLVEVTTIPAPASDAANNMSKIQNRIGTWAKEKGYHLSASPVVSNGKTGAEIKITGSAGTHTNSSLNPVGRMMEDERFNSAHSINEKISLVDGRSANVAQSINQVNKETPLWSFHGEEDFVRLNSGDGTPKAYNMGIDKTGNPGGIEFRRNHPAPETPQTMGRDPFHGQSLVAAHLEERYANARIDPHVSAFRTLLGQYHGLENPLFTEEQIVDPRFLTSGKMPQTWADMTTSHLPADSIVRKYIGDLYTADTLEYIDERARNPSIRTLESSKFQWTFPRTELPTPPTHINETPPTSTVTDSTAHTHPPTAAAEESTLLSKAEQTAEEVAKSSNGKKWIIGGMIAGAVLLGSMIALNKNKSFTEKEQDRRQSDTQIAR